MEDREILEKAIKVLTGNDTGLKLDFEATAQAISNILKENENLKQAIKINHDLYETKCNENKELEEQIEKFYEGEIFTAKQLKNIEQNQKKYFINKQVVKEKIEELEKEIQEKQEYCCDFTLIHEHEIDTNGIIQVLQELLGKEK